MSYSRPSRSSISSKYSDVGSVEDSLSRTSLRSSRLDSTDSSTLTSVSSVRRSTAITSSSFDADEDSTLFRRSSRTSALADNDDLFGTGRRSLRSRIDDDADSGIASIRRTSRLSSRDEDTADLLSSARRTSRLSSKDEDTADSPTTGRKSYLTSRMSSKDEDDSMSSFRMSSKTSSHDEEDGVSIRKATKMSSTKESDEKQSYAKSKFSSSLDMDDENSSLSIRKNKASSAFEKEDESGSTKIKSSFSSFSHSESFSSESKGGKVDLYEAIIDFEPISSDKEAIPLKEGQQVELLDDTTKPRRWFVRTRPFQDRPGGIEGWVPSCYLEKVTTKSVTSTTVTDVTKEYIDPKEQEASTKRAAVVKELVETEEDFSRDMQFVVRKYIREMESSSMASELREYKNELFGNFAAISDFHNNELIKGVQYYSNEPSKLGVTFLRLERDFDKHVTYCKNEPRAQELLTTTPLKQYFDELAKKIEDDKTLADHLKLPIQRINDYQLLLKELIKYTSRLNEDTTDLDRALEFMQAIPQKASDAQFLNAIQGYKGNLHKFGRMLCHDWFEVTEGASTVIKEQYLFLFKGRLCFTDVKRVGLDKDIYTMKNIVKLHEVKVVESSEDKSLTLQHPNPSEPGFPLKLKARTSVQKESWVKELVENAIPNAIEDLGEDEPVPIPEEPEKTTLETEKSTENETKSDQIYRESQEVAETLVESVLREAQATVDSSNIVEDVSSEPKIEILEDFEAYEEMHTQITESIRSGSITSIEASELDAGNAQKPRFRKPLRGVTCQLGETVTLECEVSTQATVSWLKNNKPVNPSSRVDVISNGNFQSLIIRDVNQDDATLYTALASNDNGTVTCSATLNVKLSSGLDVAKEDSRPTTPGGSIMNHAPVFKVKLKDTELLENTSVRFELVVRGQPEPKVTFYKDDRELIEDDRVKVVFENKERFELVIDHISHEQTGKYVCKAVNNEGEAVTEGNISITSLVNQLLREPEAPQITANLTDVEVSEGGSAMLELKVTGFPKPDLKWFNGEKEIEAGGRFKFLYEDVESTTLVIKNVVKSDAGNYKVIAINDIGEVSTTAKLSVTSPPSFRKQLKDASVMTDEKLKLEIEVEGTPTPDIKWYKDGQPLSQSKLVKLEHPSDEVFALVIEKTKPENAGSYSCVVSNPHGTQSGFAAVTVNSPPSFVLGLKSVEGLEDETITFSVKVAGSPKPTVKWTKNGSSIKETERIKIVEEENSYSLVIEKVTKEDAGKYECQIKNDYGSDSSSGTLGIKSKPVFSKKLNDMNFKAGDMDVSLDVKVEGIPKPNIRWLFNGKEVSESKNIKITSNDETGAYSLLIKEVEVEMGGEYTCEATNSVGKTASSGVVTVNAAAKIVEGLKDTNATLGQDVSFTIKFKGNPKPDAKWSKNGASLTIDGTRVTVKEEASDQLTLIIHKVVEEDKAEYSVEITNVFGKDSSKAKLLMDESATKPSFKKSLTDKNVKKGESVKFTTIAEGSPQPKIKWVFNETEIVSDSSHVLTSDSVSGEYTMTLKSAKEADAGKYTCEASNSAGKADTSAKLKVQVPPKFEEGLKDTTVSEGQSATFKVKISGDPKPKVTWMKADLDLKIDGSKVKVTEEASNEFTLILQQVDKNDSGKYSCKISNEYGEEISSAKLIVEVVIKEVDDSEAPTFIRHMTDTLVIVGDAARFEVKVSGKPQPSVKWFKGEEEIVSDSRTKISCDEKDSLFTLTIKDLILGDSSNFTCKASNDKGDAKESAKLTVKEPVAPKIEGLSNVEVSLGSVAKFEIKVTGLPSPDISWSKSGSTIRSSDNIVITSDEKTGVYSLAVRSVSETDIASYTCKASNSAGQDEKTAEIVVKAESPKFVKELKDTVTQIGESVTFEVRVTGYPTPEITWSKDSETITTSKKTTLTQKDDCFILCIKEATSSDIGSYTCKAKNTVGEAKSSATLKSQDSAPVLEKGLPPKLSVKESEPLKLEGKVNGQPLPAVQWLKDGKPIKPSDRIKIETLPDGTVKLTIDKATPDDAGKYELVAKNEAGEVKSPCNVTVKPTEEISKPEFVTPLQATDLIEGTPARLEVKATGSPRPQITWLKNGETIDSDNGHVSVECEPDGSSALVIQSPTPEDAGKYTCIASNDAGDATSAAPVAVIRPPVEKAGFSQGLKPVDLIDGEPARLEAKVSGEPKPVVKWTKNGEELSPDGHVTILEEPDGTVALLLDKTTPEDAGEYAVVVSNDAGETTSTAPVTVTPAAKPAEKIVTKAKPEFDQPLMPALLTEGDSGKLQAKISGEDKPKVSWLKDGKPIVPSEHLIPEIKPDGTLILNIDKVTPEDTGKYAVVVSNEGGESKSEAKVTTIPKIVAPQGKKPEFEKGLETLKNLTEGEPLKLEAKVIGDPTPVIKWLKDGEEIVPSIRVYTKEEPQGNVELSIDHALPEDSGKYAVVATNDEGKTRSPCLVEVKAMPKQKPEVSIGLSPTALTAGQPGKLTAKPTGSPKPAVKWLKNGQEVIPDGRIKINEEPDGSFTLCIDSVVPEDAGKYSVVAANEFGEIRSSAPVTVNQPPIFIKPLKSAEGVEGYSSKLEALLSGEPAPDIKWLKDGKNFKPDGNHVKAFQTPEGNIRLVFDHCIPQDGANYCCVATNSHGEASTDGDLKVLAAEEVSSAAATAPAVVSPLNDIEVKEGEPIRLEAGVSGSPLPTIQWFLDDQPIFPSDNINQTFDGTKAVLEVLKSNPHHAGKYECKAVNASGEANTKGNVKVIERSAPKFIQRLVDLEASSSEPLSLQCRVIGFPEPEIQWLFNGTVIEPGLKYNMTREGDRCTLTLPHPRGKDKGCYECVAKNSVGEDKCKSEVQIKDKGEKGQAPMFLKKLGDCDVIEGNNAKLTACITGVPAPEIKWFRDGEQFDFTPRHRVELEPNGLLRFHIRDVQPEDFGEYRLSISNPYGSDTCTGKLRPESDKLPPSKPLGDQYAGFDKFKESGAPVPLPDKPRITRMSDDNLTLAWKPSVPNYPRSPVTYQVEHMPHPDGTWSPYRSGIKDTTCDVRDLRPDQDYRYRVRVENEHGKSDPSPYTTAHRSKLRPSSPAEFKPKDYEIEHAPLDKNAAAPRFLRKEEETMYGIKGRPVSIEFWVYGYPQPNVTWSFNNNKIEAGGQYDFLQDRNGQVMVFITRMTEDVVGTYMCHAVNEHGEAKQKIKLLIAEPPKFIQRLEESTIMIRRSGRLECRVIGEPFPKIKWFKDWQPLHESSRIKILFTEPDKCSLFLSDSILKDSGLYSCSATNIAGTATTSAMVTIEESESEYDLLTYVRPRVVKPKSKPIEDHYDLGDELGRGTQGVTYHAVERATGKSYAAKVMHGKGIFKDYMASEIDIMNQLNHQRLVRLWDTYDTKFSSSLITDLCGGGELLDHILKKGSLTESEVAHYIRQVLEGLEHMHAKNIGHLGLTIGDILVARLNGDNLKIGDFGLSTRLHAGRNYIQLYGHPEFVAPELVKKQPASLAADMWSVGVVSYLLLSGISPFLGANDRETLNRVQDGKINFFHDAFAEVSDDARDFISKLLVFEPRERLDVKSALTHPWLKLAEIPDKGDNLNNIERLRDYYQSWKNWHTNASCRTCYRRRAMETCFTHPSKMIYPPGEGFTPNESPEKELNRTKPKPAEFDDTYQQKINREAIDIRSESMYQNGPDTYLLQLRDTDFPRRVRQYLRVGASRSPSLASNLREGHWGDTHVAVRERRRFTDVMDEEIDDEKRGLATRSVPLRLTREVGTLGYAHEQIESLKQEAWKGKGEREAIIGGAPFFRERIIDVIIRDNQDCLFSCFAVGNPKPAYSWFRNDGILITSSRIKVKENVNGRCELHLTPGKVYDVGVYKCVARNSHGVAVCRARLKIGDIPGKPEAPEINQCSDCEIYVVWSAPRYGGNSQILCYSLEYKKADQDTWTKIAANIEHEFFVAKDLSPSSGYHFRISAMNQFGWSEFSVSSKEATTSSSESPNKIRVSKARKFQQAAMNRNLETTFCPDDDDESGPFSYEQEESPVQLKTEGETSDFYNFTAEINRGRFSMTVKTWLKERGETLVSKLILTTNENEDSVMREFEIMKSLCHKHIVRLAAASRHDQLTVLVMEKLSGIDVLTYLSSKHQYNEETVAKIIVQVLEALDYLHHRGICYIELQPDNVVLEKQRQLHVKLVDFGCSHFIPKAGGKVDLQNGTTEYLAPEVIKKEEVNAASDIWGVAVLAYILLSGVSPFAGETEPETRDNVSYVRYRFENLHKEVTQEATRFLMHIFKRTPSKRPTVEECLEHKWLLPSEFLLKKREHAVFLTHKLREFSEQYHAQKQAATPPRLLNMFGMTFARSISLENDTFEDV